MTAARLLVFVFAVAFAGTLGGALLARALPSFGSEAIVGALGVLVALFVGLSQVLQTWRHDERERRRECDQQERERRRERDQAIGLRRQLRTELATLRHPVELRTNPGHIEAPGTFACDTEEREKRLSVLLVEAHVLGAEASSQVHAVHDRLVQRRALGGLPCSAAGEFLNLIDRAIGTLDTGLASAG